MTNKNVVANDDTSGVHSLCQWSLRISAVVLVTVTLFPMIPTGIWWIRGWDFPRLQIAMCAALFAGIARWHLRFTRGKREVACLLVILLTVTVWQASHVLPFTRLWTREVALMKEGAPTYRLLVANLKFENNAHQEVAQQLRFIDADVLILIEVNKEWARGLAEIREQYSFRHEEILEDGLGMAVWAKLPGATAETRFLVEDRRPSIWATMEFQGRKLHLVAVHPTPPGLLDSTGPTRRDSRVRDAELVLVAREIAKTNGAWIVAGDFNDVAWSHTTRLFKQIGGLVDPRIGRPYMGTYPADIPLCRFPIDHVFLSKQFSVRSLSLPEITGSDHLGVATEIGWSQLPNSDAPDQPSSTDLEEAKELVQEGKEDAQQRGVASE